jgi:hypothetical protein
MTRARVARLLFALAVFAAMAGVIVSRPEKRLTDFDQSFYLTIAYDLVHHGTFSNGVFDTVDGTRAAPRPGMFFAPLYPLLVAGAAKLDPHFGRVLDCTIAANEGHGELGRCGHDVLTLHLAHALFATIGVLAIAAAGEAIFTGAAVFYLAGMLATVGIATEAELLSFLMTESLSFAVFSLFGFTLVRALNRRPAWCAGSRCATAAHDPDASQQMQWSGGHDAPQWRWRDWALVGLAAGVAALTRPTYLLLIPLALVVIAADCIASSRRAKPRSSKEPARKDRIAWRSRRDHDGRASLALSRRFAAALPSAFALVLAAGLVLAPWLVRNAVSVGKIGFTEEYGAAAIIERFAFNAMTAKEFALAFPYCVPVIGPASVTALAGPDAMARFEWDVPGSFFEQGRARREALVKAHGRLDPIIGDLMRSEIAREGWRHVATSVPLSWCGLWVAGLWSVPLLPLFAVACVIAARRRPLFLAYALPALVLVGVHGVLANHYPRYNLGLIGPVAVGAAWLILLALDRLRPARVAPG